MVRIVAIGEAMLELAGGPPAWRLGVAGDVFNTAVHLSRSGHATRFLTAVGTDAFSSDMVTRFRTEGIDTTLVLRNPDARPGLYAVSIDAHGERSFTYWRDTSAARTMLDLPASAAALAAASDCDLLYFSLITLAILPASRRGDLLDLAATVRARGGVVAFDSNFRPALWPDRSSALRACEAAIAVSTIGLPTLDDECALRGPNDAAAIAQLWQDLGCREVVVKLGADGCRLPTGELVAPDTKLAPVDTSGAGDAFNGGFLAALLNGASPREAAGSGNALAGRTIMHHGAIPPRGD